MSKHKLTPSKFQQFIDDKSESEPESDGDDSVKDPDYEEDKDSGEENEDFIGFSEEEADNELQRILSDLIIEEENEYNNGIGNEESDESTNIEIEDQPIWSEFTGRQKNFPFTGKQGLQIPLSPNITPIEAFSLIVDDNIIGMICEQTNIYAAQEQKNRSQTTAKKPIKSNSRLNKWVDVDIREIKIFLGLVLWMGLDKRGTIEEYWSNDPLFVTPITAKGQTLSRNRFQLILNCFHFSNNELMDKSDRLAKIQPLIDALTTNYPKIYVPAQDFVIDETLVPWRGRLIFRQYIPNKAHKYGVKLFKLCSLNGYTFNLSVYSGQTVRGIRDVGLAESVCENLSKDLVNEGRTLYVDNFYTSYSLAVNFLKKTHVVGTVRTGRKKLSKVVADKKLKKGEVISQEDQNGIVMLKWKDKRDVKMLSTKHSPCLREVPRRQRRPTHQENEPEEQAEEQLREQTEEQPMEQSEEQEQAGGQTEEEAEEATGEPQRKRRRTEVIQKPEIVLAYNKGKVGIDVSDQMASYVTTLRKGVKWYRKLGLELLLGMSVVNALIIYKEATGKKIKIREFRKSIASVLLECSRIKKKPVQKQMHVMKKRLDDQNKPRTLACKPCYEKFTKELGSKAARKKNKKTVFYCPSCEDQPQMCYECFISIHENKTNE